MKYDPTLTFQIFASMLELTDSVVDRNLLREVEAVQRMGEFSTRNIYSWELEFDTQLKQYREDYEEKKCTERNVLKKSLDGLKNQISRVEYISCSISF